MINVLIHHSAFIIHHFLAPLKMQRTLLLAKIHSCTLTAANLNYVGSISIDRTLLDAAGILPYEQVQVVNVANGERFITYAIVAPAIGHR